MTTVLLSIGLFLLLFAAMAVGIMLGREPIKGSCGGMAALGLKSGCEICGGDRNKCDSATSEAPDNEAGPGAVQRYEPGK